MGYRRQIWTRAFAALALLAFAARALTPAGYMLAPTQDGRFIEITLCSEHGALDAVLDRETGNILPDGQSAPNEEDQRRGPCVFAAVAHLAPPEVGAAVFAETPAIEAFIPRALNAFPGRGLAAPPPWSTGPPIQA